MYFSIDLDREKIVDQNGVSFTADQFGCLLTRYARQRKPVDMTMMLQRFVQLSVNPDVNPWKELKEFYNE